MTALTQRQGAATRRTRSAAPPSKMAMRAKRAAVRRTRKAAARAQIPVAFWVIVGTVATLTLLGLIMVLSVTTVKSTYEHDTAGYFFTRQMVFVALGTFLLLAAYKFGHRRIAMFAPTIMVSSIVALVAVLFIAEKVNGSKRWFSIGFFNVQPSEVAKLAVILWVARLLASRSREMHDWRRTIVPVAAGLGLNVLLIVVEPDLGTAVVLIFVVLVMLVVAGARIDILALGSIPVALVLTYLALSGYHADRWGFLNPLENMDTSNYQLAGSLSSVASGGLFGVGPGASTAKWGFLPEAHTDAIFAVITEEMGVIGALLVIALYVVLLGAGMRVARDAADVFGRLLAIGITTLISVQAFVNIGVSLGVLPNKGFTLPFVSYGGSSLLVTMFAVGLLLSVAREGSASRAAARRRLQRERTRRTETGTKLRLVGSTVVRQAATRKPATRKPAARQQPATRTSTTRRQPAPPARKRTAARR